MSLKQEIETWVAALAAYDNNEFDNSIECFRQIADQSKILFNLGVINATLGEHAKAVEYYQHAVQLDQYLAVAYFQQGVSNFLMGDFEEALANFNDTLLYLRGNNNIDYEQLGLKFKLYSCEVLFNRGLSYIYLQQKDAGMQDLTYAAREKRVPDHDVIDEAIREQAEGYTVFSIPVGVVYRPNEAKVKNLQAKDYLGKARLVAAQERQNTARARAALAAISIDDRPEEKLSYAALNLVKPDLRSRSRQQSEPPMNRNIFPPTPPPEPEQADVLPLRARRKSSESTSSATAGLAQSRPSAKPMRLELGVAAFDQRTQPARPQPKRSESERLAPRRRHPDAAATREQHSRSYDPQRRHPDVPEVYIEEDPIKPFASGSNSGEPSSHATASASVRHMRSISNTNSNHSTSTRGQPTISEEDEEEDIIVDTADDEEDASSTSDRSNLAPPPLAFEIIPPHRSHRRHPSNSKRPAAAIPPPEMRRVRIKVHGADDMRYIMASATASYAALAEQIRVKFSLPAPLSPQGQERFKLKVKDEDGDLITMGDDDDWEMALALCRAAAARERVEVGKMEVWLVEVG